MAILYFDSISFYKIPNEPRDDQNVDEEVDYIFVVARSSRPWSLHASWYTMMVYSHHIHNTTILAEHLFDAFMSNTHVSVFSSQLGANVDP